mgnify:CR=1 FL=1
MSIYSYVILIISLYALSVNTETNYLRGDANGDGITEYLVINKTETRLYQSSIGYSWGYVQLNYIKTNVFFKNDAFTDPENSAGLIGDITCDGVSEFVMVGKNDAGYQIFMVYNGSTLDIYPMDAASKALLVAGDGKKNVEVESKALFEAFNHMGITLDDLDGVYTHFESLQASSFRN